eukprot:2561601-Pyramimonas_sp.AAC.1
MDVAAGETTGQTVRKRYSSKQGKRTKGHVFSGLNVTGSIKNAGDTPGVQRPLHGGRGFQKHSIGIVKSGCAVEPFTPYHNSKVERLKLRLPCVSWHIHASRSIWGRTKGKIQGFPCEVRRVPRERFPRSSTVGHADNTSGLCHL